jgi:hypothetical protein
VITPQQRIRRSADGAVDIESYRAQTLTERAAARFPQRKPRRARTLAVAAMMLAPAGALVVCLLAIVGVVHILNSAPSTAVAGTGSAAVSHAAGKQFQRAGSTP